MQETLGSSEREDATSINQEKRLTPKVIERLAEGEVFVFGTNASGFHGAGSAGLAFRGEARNTWREDKFFLRAMSSPAGSIERVGRWAVFGQSRGLMLGTEGMSFGIETIRRPGLKRSTPLFEIEAQLSEL